jgi:hypothetical protein
MQTFVVQPLVGIGAVQLGSPRDVVLAALGPCAKSYRKSTSSRFPTDVWFDGGLQVFYGGDAPTVEYIELSSHAGVAAILLGHDVFATPASSLVSLVQEHARVDDTDAEQGFSYVFPSLELSLWRPVATEPEGHFFSTIGVGTRGYYSNDA